MFDIWRLRRAKAKLNRALEREIAALQQAGKKAEAEMKAKELDKKQEAMEDRINALASEPLERKASMLDLPLPPFPHLGQPNEFWTWSPSADQLVLTRIGRATVRERIRKDSRERFDSKARWITLLTGIIGAAIGLVSVLTNFIARLFNHH